MPNNRECISWKPGYYAEDGSLAFGGWLWHYELTPDGSSATKVTLSYDWTSVSEAMRQRIGFPPFPREHLSNSLQHLDELASISARDHSDA